MGVDGSPVHVPVEGRRREGGREGGEGREGRRDGGGGRGGWGRQDKAGDIERSIIVSL